MKMINIYKVYRLVKWVRIFGKELEILIKLFEVYFIKGLSIYDDVVLLDIVKLFDFNVNDVKVVFGLN